MVEELVGSGGKGKDGLSIDMSAPGAVANDAGRGKEEEEEEEEEEGLTKEEEEREGQDMGGGGRE